MGKTFYCPVQLSEHLAMTPEGYLLCKDVAISKSGDFFYRSGELPGLNAINGYVTINRPVREIHDPLTIASAEGKSIVIEHPPSGFVTPETWKALTVGMIQNVRPGSGDNNDKLMADLLITDANAIQLVQSKTIREVSLAYVSEYIETQPGFAVQTAIRANHLALTQNGRCGSDCAVHDSQPNMENDMSLKALKERVLKAFDEAPVEGGDVADLKASVAAITEELKGLAGKMAMFAELKTAIEALSAKEKPEVEGAVATDAAAVAKKKADEEAAAKGAVEAAPVVAAGDGCKVGDSAPDTLTISRAEILAPNVTRDKNIKRAALDSAIKTDPGKAIITTLCAGRAFDSLTQPELDMVFVAASEYVKSAREAQKGKGMTTDSATMDGPMTPEMINEINAKHFEKRS